MENLKKEKWTDCVALLFLFFISGISQFIGSFAETCVFLNWVDPSDVWLVLL